MKKTAFKHRGYISHNNKITINEECIFSQIRQTSVYFERINCDSHMEYMGYVHMYSRSYWIYAYTILVYCKYGYNLSVACALQPKICMEIGCLFPGHLPFPTYHLLRRLKGLVPHAYETHRQKWKRPLTTDQRNLLSQQ